MVSGVQGAEVAQGKSSRAMLNLGLGVFFAMNVMVFTMALWSYDVYPIESFETPLARSLRNVFRWASMLFSLPVLWLLGGPILDNVWQTLRRRMLTTDLLILMGISAAYVYSVVSVLRGSGHVYFEVGVMVLLFVSLGRWLEAKGKRKTTESLDRLMKLLPETARRLVAGEKWEEVSLDSLNQGDLVRVLAGDRFPVDGCVVRGRASVDQQLVTGESSPVECGEGDRVCSGTINLDGELHVRVTSVNGQETLSRIVAMIRTARLEKGRQEILADRIARWFVPLVCLVAIVAGWYQTLSAGLDDGMLTSLAVVLIACPCALGLATPMAVWTALGRAAERGVLFRSGLVLERLAEVRTACFDKTGTLTTGRPQVSEIVSRENASKEEVLRKAVLLAAGSTHPLSQAILSHANGMGCDVTNNERLLIQSIAGKGVAAAEGTIRVLLGSRKLMAEHGFTWPESGPLVDGESLSEQRVFVGWDGKVQGAFEFSETLRSEVVPALAACRRLCVEPRLLTGDNATRADRLRDMLGIPTQASQLPEDKLQTIESLKSQGPVAMVGDGINDAPALAAADVGVALGCGADVSRESAGVCLASDNLSQLPWAIGLARQTSLIVKQNLFWAFAYNGIGIGLAATGRLNPILAAAAMAVSSLLVIFNSLRLAGYDDIELGVGSGNRSATTKENDGSGVTTEEIATKVAEGAWVGAG